MGFPCGSVRICASLATQILSLPLFNVLINYVKTILIHVITQLHLVTTLQNTLSLACRTIRVYLQDDDGGDDKSTSSDRDRPSPSLVPLPPHILAQSIINTKLPLVLYRQHLVEGTRNSTRTRARELLTANDEERLCVVCRNLVELDHEIRELPNCCHVFHSGCLDGWIDQGCFTCPLCRANLGKIDDEEEVLKGEGTSDPWRKERMVYLFGEDFVMS